MGFRAFYCSTVLSFGFFLCLFAIQSKAEIHDSQSSRSRTTSNSSNSSSCLGEMSPAQIQVLDQIKAITASSGTAEEKARRLYSTIQDSPSLTNQQRSAVAAIAVGSLKQQTTQSSSAIENMEHINILLQYGAKPGRGGLNLETLDFTKINQFRNSLKKIYPETASAIAELGPDLNTKAPLFIGNVVLMPPATDRDPKARILTQGKYQDALRNTIQILEANLQQYIESSNEAASTYNQTRAAIIGGTADSPPAKMAEQYYNLLMKRLETLRDQFGYPAEKLIAIRNQVREALKKNDLAVDSGLSGVYWQILYLKPERWSRFHLDQTRWRYSHGD